MNSSSLENQAVIIKVRCPSCFKLYAVDETEISEARPQFSCVKCSKKFWFPYPEYLEQKELLGFPVDWIQPVNEAASEPVHSGAMPQTTSAQVVKSSVGGMGPGLAPKSQAFNCPRCQAPYTTGDAECPKCGVVFAKLDFLENGKAVVASSALRKSWHQVMDQYDSVEAHRRFVQACQKENNLPYASHQYRKLLEAHSGDEMALKMQKEIKAIGEVIHAATPASRRSARRFFPRLTTLVMLMGGVLVGLGMMLPVARNLVGLGVAVVFFTVAADWFFRKG